MSDFPLLSHGIEGPTEVERLKVMEETLAELREETERQEVHLVRKDKELGRLREEVEDVRDSFHQAEASYITARDELTGLREELDTRTTMLVANDEKWANAVAELAKLREWLEKIESGPWRETREARAYARAALKETT